MKAIRSTILFCLMLGSIVIHTIEMKDSKKQNKEILCEPIFEMIKPYEVRGDLSNVDCSGCDLSGIRFIDIIIDGVNFEKADLENVYFENARGTGVSFKGAYLVGAQFIKAVLVQVNFNKSILKEARFEQSRISASQCHEMQAECMRCECSTFERCTFTKSVLREARCTTTRFIDVSLTGVCFAKAHFNYCAFFVNSVKDCDMSEATIEGASSLFEDPAWFQAQFNNTYEVINGYIYKCTARTRELITKPYNTTWDD